jgi:hypothetical protein
MELCLMENPVEDWDDIRAWSGTVLRRDCFKTTLCILCLGAATHHIWKQIEECHPAFKQYSH